MAHRTDNDSIVVERVRAACLDAAIQAYEDAGIRGCAPMAGGRPPLRRYVNWTSPPFPNLRPAPSSPLKRLALDETTGSVVPAVAVREGGYE